MWNVCWLLNRGKDDTSFVSVSHRRLDVKLKHDSDPDKKHPDKKRKEKHNEHLNKKRHADDPSDEKHPEEPQNEKHLQEIRKEEHLEEPKKRHVEDAQVELNNKKQKHLQDLQSEKHRPEPRKERPLGEPKKMRHMEEVKKEKRTEPKKHSYSDDMKKDKQREEGRHERSIKSPQRERPPTEPQKEKPAFHKSIFERWDGGGSKLITTHQNMQQSFRLNYLFQERSDGQQSSVSHSVPLSSTCSASSLSQTPLCGPEKRQVRTVTLPELKSMMDWNITAWPNRFWFTH